MTTWRVLRDELEVRYQRGQLASSPRHYFPELASFMKYITENTALDTFLEDIPAAGSIEEFESLIKLKKRVFIELSAARNALIPYKNDLPGLSDCFATIDHLRRTSAADSWDLACAFNVVLMRACNIILYNEKEIPADLLIRLIRLNDKHWIEEYIFAPSLKQFNATATLFEHYRKTNLGYRLLRLVTIYQHCDPKNRNKYRNAMRERHGVAAAALFAEDAKIVDRVLDIDDPEDARKLGYHMEEYKLDQHDVWTYLNKRLLNAARRNIAMDRDKRKKEFSIEKHGTNVYVWYGDKEISFSTSHRPGRFILAFSKKPAEQIPYGSLSAQVMDNRDETMDGASTHDLEEVYKSANKRFREGLGIPKAFQKTKAKAISNNPQAKKQMWLNPKLVRLLKK